MDPSKDHLKPLKLTNVTILVPDLELRVIYEIFMFHETKVMQHAV